MNRKVKALMMEKGVRNKDIAAELGIGAPAVSGAINGHWVSNPVRDTLARKLGITRKRLDKMWDTEA